MRSSGTVLKMKSAFSGAGEPVRYSLPLGDSLLPMNDLIGQPVALGFNGDIFCVGCSKKTKKTFQDGYCYACFLKVPECEECVMRPELCRAHEGQARDMDWARTHCLIDQFVYISITSDVKVGVTRHTQIPTRWIDQGAVRAIKLARTPNRYTAGLIEVALKKHMKDKTDWRRMLKNEYPDLDLVAIKKKAAGQLPADLAAYVLKDDEITNLVFPVKEYADKVRSLGFDKEPVIAGTLMGIKGQYLLFDGGRVVNIRKHQGYLIELSTGADAGGVGAGLAKAPAVAPAAKTPKNAKKSAPAKVAKKKTEVKEAKKAPKRKTK